MWCGYLWHCVFNDYILIWKFPIKWSKNSDEIDSSYRHEMLQGVVNDENAYAMGGVAGHAGL